MTDGKEKKTNYDAIVGMTLEEMAQFLCGGEFSCKGCAFVNNEQGCKTVKGQYRDWLKKEVKDGENNSMPYCE